MFCNRAAALLTLLCALIVAQPCAAALVATGLGKTQATPNGSHQMAITTSADCPAGSLNVAVSGSALTTPNLSSIADQASNTYGAPFDAQSGTNVGLQWADAPHTASDLPSGDSETWTYTNSSSQEFAAAVCITGAITSGALDVSGATANGSGTSASVSSGTLAQSNEILLATIILGGSAGGNFSCGGSWTRAEQVTSGGSPTGALCTLVVSGASAVTFAPSWTTSGNYVVDIISFKGPASAAANGGLLRRGAGP